MRIAFVATFALLGVLSTGMLCNAQELERKADGWKSVELCSMSFSVPDSLVDKKARGIDSCIAVLSDDAVSLSLDYGLYSGVSRYDHYLNFTEKRMVIDGKKGSFSTYRDSTMDPEKSWVGRLFVVVEPPKDGWPETAMNMFVVVKSKAELSVAEKIVRSIKFK